MSFKILVFVAIASLAIASDEFLMGERDLQSSVFNSSLIVAPYTACTVTAHATDSTWAYDSCHKLIGDLAGYSPYSCCGTIKT
jgi:hypothetical protein